LLIAVTVPHNSRKGCNSRIRKENAPQNFAILRQIALNLLNQEKTLKKGIKRKRNKRLFEKFLEVKNYAKRLTMIRIMAI
jgi:hypothetical protein